MTGCHPPVQQSRPSCFWGFCIFLMTLGAYFDCMQVSWLMSMWHSKQFSWNWFCNWEEHSCHTLKILWMAVRFSTFGSLFGVPFAGFTFRGGVVFCGLGVCLCDWTCSALLLVCQLVEWLRFPILHRTICWVHQIDSRSRGLSPTHLPIFCLIRQPHSPSGGRRTRSQKKLFQIEFEPRCFGSQRNTVKCSSSKMSTVNCTSWWHLFDLHKDHAT